MRDVKTEIVGGADLTASAPGQGQRNCNHGWQEAYFSSLHSDLLLIFIENLKTEIID
jgi:hypothetical protein